MIAGLPSTGKSTYIGALYTIEKDGKSGHELTCVKYPPNTAYLDNLRKNWQSMKIVDRTTLREPVEVELTMKKKEDGHEIVITLPDVAGEIFSDLIMNNISPELLEWCKECDSILFFVRNLTPMVLQDELPKDDTETPEERSQRRDLELKDIPDVIKNIMVLKFLNEQMGKCKIAICVSAWDEVTDLEKGETVEAWLKRNYPFLYQYVESHFTTPTYYGISAQGSHYVANVKAIQKLMRQTESKKRAYIYLDKKDYDITKPLAGLL